MFEIITILLTEFVQLIPFFVAIILTFNLCSYLLWG